MSAIVTIALLVLAVEAITEILVTGSIFDKPREWLASKSSFFGELIYCGYCTSVWVSASVAWISILELSGVLAVDYFITVMVLHRSSNLLHELISKFLGRRPLSLAIHKTEAVLLPEQFGVSYEGQEDGTGNPEPIQETREET